MHLGERLAAIRHGARFQLVDVSELAVLLRNVFPPHERAKAIEIGEKYLEKEARRFGVQVAKVTRADLERVAAEYGFAKTDDLYAALGYGKFSPRKIIQKIAPEAAEPEPAPRAAPLPAAGGQTGDLILKVTGMDDLLGILQQSKVDQKLTLSIVRDGKQMEVTATLAARPANP